MNEALIGNALGLVILLWCFWLMLSPIMPKGGGSLIPSGGGCLSKIISGVFTIVLLPIVWRLISLVAMVYHRTFVVSTEFVSGVHDWPSYRTSSFKYLGALLAFLGFNALLFFLLGVIPLAVALTAGQPQPPRGAWMTEAILLGASLLCYTGTRFFMRRMP